MTELDYVIFPFGLLRQRTASLVLLASSCFCALFSDMNTESALLTVAFPALFLASVCGYSQSHSSNRNQMVPSCGLICIYLLPLCLCRAVGALDYFHVSGISSITSYGITLSVLTPIMASVLIAALVQKNIWMHTQQLQEEQPAYWNWIIQLASPLAFPVLLCGIFQLLFQFSPIGATGNPAMGLQSVAAPTVLQLTSVIGEIGLVFGIGWISSLGAGQMVGRLSRFHMLVFATMWASTHILGGWRLASRMGLLATPIQEWPLSKAPKLQVSCLCQKTHNNTEIMIDRANARLAAGDDLVIMSEAAIQERITPDMLNWPMEVNPGAVVAVAFVERLNNSTLDHGNSGKWYNSIELFQANKSIGRYNKNRPVPIIEAKVVAGKQPPKPIKIVFTPFMNNHTDHASGKSQRGNVTLKVASAICFDFDFPSLIQHAKEADLVIGPSQYWGSLGRNMWSDNMYRAIENGFTLFKCAHDGISGAVDPFGRPLVAQATLAGDTFMAQVPVQPRVSTIYAHYGGYCFGWICVLLSPMLIVYASVLSVRPIAEVDDDDNANGAPDVEDDLLTNDFRQLLSEEEADIGDRGGGNNVDDTCEIFPLPR